ncbi:MAG: hypothetical protein WAU36_13300 [Cyclobacteriaceae bacterium]
MKQAAYEVLLEIIHFSAISLRKLEYDINLFISEFNVGFQFVKLG